MLGMLSFRSWVCRYGPAGEEVEIDVEVSGERCGSFYVQAVLPVAGAAKPRLETIPVTEGEASDFASEMADLWAKDDERRYEDAMCARGEMFGREW